MATPRIQIQIGYPDFFPGMYQRHEKFFAVIQNVGPTIDDVFSRSHPEPLRKVCRHLAKMVANSMSSAILLGVNGFGNDSLKIVRSMFEAAVTIAYLRQHPEELDDYLDFHFIVAMKRIRYMERYDSKSLAKVPAGVIASNNAGYAKVKSRYTNRQGKVRGRWSRKPLSAICAELHLEELYLAFYDPTSHIVHADISGVAAQGDQQPGVLDVEIAPSEMYVEMALRSAHCYFVLAVSEYVALARPDKQGIADQIEKDFVTAWKT